MLRLRALAFERPTSVQDLTERLTQQGDAARLLAGGTDLMPNLKLGTVQAATLLSLSALPSLSGIRRVEAAPLGSHDAATPQQALELGAATTLDVIANHPLVQRELPALAAAVARIASPQIRNRATLAGNLCVDTRCRYINQSELFRVALGGCLKSHGSECHVVPGGQNCVAALSCDTAPVLIALDAVLALTGGADGDRTLPLADFYNTDGLSHTNLRRGEVIVAVRVPVQRPDVLVTYRKWARRHSIDFPLVSVALRLETETHGETTRLTGGQLVVGALGPRPRIVQLKAFVGRDLDATLATALGALAVKRCRPLPNLPYDETYRRRRLGVETQRAVMALIVMGPAALPARHGA